jgi:hypothetical protein
MSRRMFNDVVVTAHVTQNRLMREHGYGYRKMLSRSTDTTHKGLETGNYAAQLNPGETVNEIRGRTNSNQASSRTWIL